VEKFEIEKLNEIKNYTDEENNNDAELRNNPKQIEYINIFWDEWKMK
jgi:hypothetical protein